MDSVLFSNVADRGFERRSGETKDYYCSLFTFIDISIKSDWGTLVLLDQNPPLCANPSC